MSSNWAENYLSDLSDEITVGYVGSMTHEYADSGIPFLRSKNISNYEIVWDDIRYISSTFHNKIKKSVLRPGDVAVVRTGKPGTSCVIPNELSEGNCSDLVIIRVDENKLCPHYLCYYLNSIAVHQINAQIVGAVQQHFNVGSAKNLKIKTPSLFIQKRISFFLQCLDNKIKLNKLTNQTLEQMVQALFKSWFVDFEPVKAKIAMLEAGGSQKDATLAAMTAISGKDSDALVVFEREHPEQYAELKATAELFPSEMQESELGEIPAGWNISNIKDNVDVRDGTHASPKASDSGYHLVTSKNITSGYLDRRSCYYISDMDYHEVNKRSRVSCGDILISMIGTVGALYFVAENNVDYAIKNIGLIRTSERQDLQAFIFYHLKSNNGVNYINSRLAGTTQKYLSLKQLREIPIVMPTQDVLAAFNKKIFLHEIHANQEITETLANIRDTLLPKLLSGEITLLEAEQAVSEVENV